jgi:hypothetical protein
MQPILWTERPTGALVGTGSLSPAISSPPRLVCCPSFSFMGGVAKKPVTKLGMLKRFLQDHMLRMAGDALTYQLVAYEVFSAYIAYPPLPIILTHLLVVVS